MKTGATITGEGRNPGDAEPRDVVARVIRVDQAGEFGAVRIYEGQLAALRWTGRTRTDTHRKIAAMARAEREAPSSVFYKMLVERRVRPTVLSLLVRGLRPASAWAPSPRWMGDKAAMACTVAVEETIDEHWREARPPRSARTRPS